MYENISHPLKPVFDTNSKILILGTMPSPKSREKGFYYAHPQNRFWRVLFELLGEDFSHDIDARRALCLSHGIALWDVLASCDISGAADSSIKNAVPNDFSAILAAADIRAVFTTGKTAARLYHKLCEDKTGLAAVTLPSPSAANCAVPFEALKQSYSVILPYLF